MLATRIVTGVLLITASIGAVLRLPSPYFVALLGALMLGCAYEVLRMQMSRLLALIALLPIVGYAYLAFFDHRITIINLAICGFWAFAVLLCAIYPRFKKLYAQRIVLWLLSFILFIPPFVSIATYHQNANTNNVFLLLLFFLIANCDTSAYFVGKFFGKRKIVANISPNKTLAGFVGAYLSTLLVYAGLYTYEVIDKNPIYILAFLALATSSIVGDLFASMLKRANNVKDTGKILPGHGGLYDRLDSIVAAVPVTLGVLQIIGTYK